MTPTTNHELLQKYINEYKPYINSNFDGGDIVQILTAIQFRLIEHKISTPVESYPIALQIDGEMYGAIVFDKALRGITVYSQSKKIEPMEYKSGDIYEFSNNGTGWEKFILDGYVTGGRYSGGSMWKFIRPIQIPDEESSALSRIVTNHNLGQNQL